MAEDPRYDILIVDDDADIRAALQELLEMEGYSVRCAEHGGTALKRLREGERPGLILLDLMMPVMDGFAFRQAQLADERLTGLNVLVFSAGRQPADPRIGNAPMLPKPLDLDRLLETVERHCRSQDSKSTN